MNNQINQTEWHETWENDTPYKPEWDREAWIKEQESRKDKALNDVINAISKHGIEKLIEFSYFDIPDVPNRRTYSLLNQAIMFSHGTHDARTYVQWKQNKRQVQKGSKAFQLIRPVFKEIPVYDDDGNPVMIKDENGNLIQKKEDKLVGFAPFNVFAIEDTLGAEYKTFDVKIPHLKDVAKRIGVNIKAGHTTHKNANAWYSITNKEIVIGTKNNQEYLYFHELGHAVDDYLKTLNKDNKDNEIVAEVVACTLARLYGQDMTQHSATYLRYFEKSKEELKEDMIHLFGRIQKVLDFILETK